MDKNTTLVAAWYGSAVTTLLFSLLFLIYLSTPKIMQPQIQTFKLYTALPKDDIEVSSSIGLKDARAKIIEDFFKGHKAPLSKYGDIFITVADKYKLDYRLLPAIAMQESNGGKKIITDSFNPFGYGIYGKLVTRFGTWEEGIERVGRALREDYLDAGLKNPVQIMAKYTPPSLAIGGTWAKGVNSFMEDLR
ncbi:hypothetical protein A3A45_00915 [Candidatus Daviesbacteria bacterium RIFCSPLOWO2_01_FULL_36_8]|nr:MAG: hypothetical protein A3A45_00915 [Candidatus Daviesbacteria bacterium RIFCSPLOWO2_01_FULL_36_8]